MRNNNKKGFTIVEIVVIVTIIGILAGIAFPSVAGVLGNANKSVDNAKAGLYESALKIYVSRKAQVQEYVYISTTAGHEDLVANSIAHILNEKTTFAAKTKDWEFYYNPKTLQVVAQDKNENTTGLLTFYLNGDMDQKVLEGDPDGNLLEAAN